MLFFGFRLKRAPGPAQTCAVGALTGLINGASANGGPPAILFFLSGPQSAAVGRASLIAFFLFTDVLASLFYWGYGLLSWHYLSVCRNLSALHGVGHLAGIALVPAHGRSRFRRLHLLLLMLAARTGLARALWLPGV